MPIPYPPLSLDWSIEPVKIAVLYARIWRFICHSRQISKYFSGDCSSILLLHNLHWCSLDRKAFAQSKLCLVLSVKLGRLIDM